MRFRHRYKTARCVLRFEDQFLLAVHSSFWARRERRWGLAGGGIERGEQPRDAVQRELQEELDVYISDFTELGGYRYKGADHMVYGAEVDHAISKYDDNELLDLRWFTLPELLQLDSKRKLHAGYELQAIRQYIALSDY